MTVPPFENATVLVAGDVMLDRYWFGPASRISPEAPVPVVRVDEIEERPGGAANVAVNLASLGVDARLVCVTGDDEAAARLDALLAARGIRLRRLARDGAPTVTKLRVLSRNQQLLRLDFEQALDEGAPDALADAFETELSAADVVVLSDYGKGSLGSVRRLIEACGRAGKPVLVDPKGTDFDRYRGATVITPNVHQAGAGYGLRITDDASLHEVGRGLLKELSCGGVLITRGDKGMTLFEQGGQADYPALAKKVYDVTGAGDTVVAVLSAALTAGADLKDAAALANYAAGLVVGELGTASVTRDELRQALQA